jgi:hypothetical protein
MCPTNQFCCNCGTLFLLIVEDEEVLTPLVSVPSSMHECKFTVKEWTEKSKKGMELMTTSLHEKPRKFVHIDDQACGLLRQSFVNIIKSIYELLTYNDQISLKQTCKRLYTWYSSDFRFLPESCYFSQNISSDQYRENSAFFLSIYKGNKLWRNIGPTIDECPECCKSSRFITANTARVKDIKRRNIYMLWEKIKSCKCEDRKKYINMVSRRVKKLKDT